MHRTTSLLDHYKLWTQYIPNWSKKELKIKRTYNSNKATLSSFSFHFSLFVLFFGCVFHFMFFSYFFSNELAKGNPQQTLNLNSSVNFVQLDKGFIKISHPFTKQPKPTKRERSTLLVPYQTWCKRMKLSYSLGLKLDNHLAIG